MSFYNELSKVYDIVFPIDETTVKFLSRGILKNSLILDAACGTGDYSIELAKLGLKVDGIDLSDEMINIAKEKSRGLSASFTAGDMTKIKEIFSGKNYDMISCIGNSIVHLNNKDTISKFIDDCFKMLKKDGELIIQTVNYDRIVKNNVTSLPLIDKKDKGVKFIRNYDYKKEEGIVYFVTELTITSNGIEQKYENSIPLIPLMHEELTNMIKCAGFSKIYIYGGFNESAYDASGSYALVVRAKK